MCLKISHRWNQGPFWFETLDRETQELLIAEYMLEHEPKKEAEKRKIRYNRHMLAKKREKWMKKNEGSKR